MVALVATVMSWIGTACEKNDAPPPPQRPATTLSAAAPDEYLPAGAPAKPQTVAMNVPKVPPAPKPTASLPKGASCVTAECHATYQTAAHIHGPVSEKACNACHDEDTGTHHFPLKRAKTETCTFCHPVNNTQPHQHAPLKTAQACMTCHDPHVSQAKFLLKADNVEQLCQKCHDTPLRKFAHDPFAKGQCTLCHEPHQSANAKLLRGGEGNQHCFSCHGAMKVQFASATTVHKPAGESCVTCHSPHSTDNSHQLKNPVDQTCLNGCHQKMSEHIASAPNKHDAVKTGMACANCHNPHASNERHLLADRTDRLCLKCHDKPMQTPDGRNIENMKVVLASSSLHGPVRVGNCSACHDAHGGANHALLDKAFPETFYTRFDIKKYELCFTCHDPNMVLTPKTQSLTNFRNGEKNLHFVHVNRDDKGRTCKTCHEMHGSDLPNHMASGVPFEGSKWAMPIDYQKAQAGGSCTPGCHKTKTYDRGGAATVILPTTRGAS